MLKMARPGIEPDVQGEVGPIKEIQRLRDEKGHPLVYVGDVVGTGSSRKSATRHLFSLFTGGTSLLAGTLGDDAVPHARYRHENREQRTHNHKDAGHHHKRTKRSPLVRILCVARSQTVNLQGHARKDDDHQLERQHRGQHIVPERAVRTPPQDQA